MAQHHTRVYEGGHLVAEGFPLARVSDHLQGPDAVVWVDLVGPSQDELTQLAEELGLHELAVEDTESHQRPKVDYYESHLFLAVHALDVDLDSGELHVEEIDAFVNHNWLITVRQTDSFDMTEVLRRWDRTRHLAGNGVGFLLYGLLDTVVDGYFDVVEAFDDYYDEVSEGLFADEPLDPARQRHWFVTRRSLVRFHRLAVPLREAVSTLMRREHKAISAEMYPYFQDIYDHILRVSESSDSLRDLVSTIVETNLSLRDYRQNQVMKKVTSWAAIIAVPTLITGYYGMNVPYPGSGTYAGVLVSAALIVVFSALLFALFRERDWL
ncbi:MAG: magnesium transporter CorA family protein [Acidimicrobiales bacterium]